MLTRTATLTLTLTRTRTRTRSAALTRRFTAPTASSTSSTSVPPPQPQQQPQQSQQQREQQQQQSPPRARKWAAIGGGLALGVAVNLAVNSINGGNRDDDAYAASFASGLGLAKAYPYLAPLLFAFVGPEDAHRLAVRMLTLAPRTRDLLGLTDASADDPVLRTRVFGLDFSNPLGMAAGFDKHAEAMDGVLDLGFAFVEVGSITPLPQVGNDKPRVFRLPEDRAVINRYGFNSDGMEAAAARLAARQRDLQQAQQQAPAPPPTMGSRSRIVGLNFGKNKTSESAIADYVSCLRTLAPYADYVVINISSPNTPNLRDLQARSQLEQLVRAVKTTRDELMHASGRAPETLPLLVKIAPDLGDHDQQDIADVCMDVRIDGLIVSNTTISRPASLQSAHKNETGGLSGPPLFDMSTKLVKSMHQKTLGSIPIIGVGGIRNGRDAFEKIKAGASLVQVYSMFAYEGPILAANIKRELAACLKAEGFRSVSEAVGVDARK